MSRAGMPLLTLSENGEYVLEMADAAVSADLSGKAKRVMEVLGVAMNSVIICTTRTFAFFKSSKRLV